MILYYTQHMRIKKSRQFEERFISLHAEGGIVVPEPEMKKIIRQYGIAVPSGRLCRTAPEAVRFCDTAKPPFVLKVVSDRVLHKTELNGVRLGMDTKTLVRATFLEMDASFKKKKVPGYTGILVEEEAKQGVDIIAGLRHDDTFGPVIMIGIGGVLTDLYEDVSFRMLPLSKKEIAEMLRELRGWPMLVGFRGSRMVDLKKLVETLYAIGRFGVDFASYYDSVDLNPIIAGPGGCCVTDAKLILAKSPRKESFGASQPRIENLDQFFRPGSVAVIGASSTPGKIGNIILDSLTAIDYRGTVYPINPNVSEIRGLKCYAALSELPAVPDLAIVVVELGLVPDIIHEMAALGVRNAIVISGGGKEIGGNRSDLERNIGALARECGVRIIGPNCIGTFDGSSRFDSFFYPKERLVRPPKGVVSFITQSGTWGCAFLECSRMTGVAKMVSYGNRADVDEGDLVSYLAGDPDTAVIGSYLEGLSDGRKFCASVEEAARKGKPVVIFKTGRNRLSAKASVSHTGAYGGTYHVYRGALDQAGAVLTDSFHECFAACESLSMQPAAAGFRVALVSNGAGPMVNAIDLFPERGLRLVELCRASVKKMRDRFSLFYLVENPIDVTGSATAADYEFVVKTLVEDRSVDIIMPFFVFQNTPLDESIVERLEAISALRMKPIVCCAVGGTYPEIMKERMNRAGLPLYNTVVQWVAAAYALARWGEIKRRFGPNRNRHTHSIL
jgi:3-hydroxypropionyl-CoA synthetase (ADP-forming)